MPEIKRPVRTVEVNYLCDKCNNGMMKKYGDTDPESGECVHRCVICDHEMIFKWVTYPRIDYVDADK